MDQDVNRDRLASLWADILSLTDHPQDVFGLFSDRLLDRGGADSDRLPHPGFVGRNYQPGGLLFLGMNPGNGPTNGPDPSEESHYEGLRRLRHASPNARRAAFDALMTYDESWYPQIRIMNVVVKPVLDGTNKGFDSIAYMNVLKWRTKSSSGLAPLYKASMRAHTLSQLEEIDPGLIILLGVGVSEVLHGIPEFQSRFAHRCITIPRTIGDYRLAPEGLAAVEQACARYRALNSSSPVAPARLEPLKTKVIKVAAPASAPITPKSQGGIRVEAPRTSRKPQADKTREQASDFRGQWHAKADALGISLGDFVLEAGRDNDVAVGMKGPRHAIVTLAQKMARNGATYKDVLGQIVTKGDGKPFKIGEGELLGYVVANGYCTLKPPAR